MAAYKTPAVVSQYFAAIGQMDADTWFRCFAEQGISSEPGAPVPLQGHATLANSSAACSRDSRISN